MLVPVVMGAWIVVVVVARTMVLPVVIVVAIVVIAVVVVVVVIVSTTVATVVTGVVSAIAVIPAVARVVRVAPAARVVIARIAGGEAESSKSEERYAAETTGTDAGGSNFHKSLIGLNRAPTDECVLSQFKRPVLRLFDAKGGLAVHRLTALSRTAARPRAACASHRPEFGAQIPRPAFQKEAQNSRSTSGRHLQKSVGEACGDRAHRL